MTRSLTRADIISGLRNLGLEAGSGVMVHSSLKSFGWVEGGAKAVIKALIEVLTPQGTLLMPSFNHNSIVDEGGAGYYSPTETPTLNGAIPDLFWRLPGVSRSLDPTHPVAAWGKNAIRYTASHHLTLTMGPQSPLGLLNTDGGYGLLLGVDYKSNTFHHLVEMTRVVPCLGQRTEEYEVRLPDGRRVRGRTWGWREQNCPLDEDALYGEEMEARALQRVVRIGSCKATFFRLSDCYNVVAEILEQGKNGFPPCSRCSIRPRKVDQTVPSDWDEENQRPAAGSPAAYVV
jgi:aminoglycoside 3-N-acetyltransferase